MNSVYDLNTVPVMAVKQRVTPTMEAGISDHVWTIAELVALLDRA